MNDPTRFSIYQLRTVLNGVSPLVWRRFLLLSETSLADLHEILQLAFGWTGFYVRALHSWENFWLQCTRLAFSLLGRLSAAPS